MARLATYLRVLGGFRDGPTVTVSSEELAAAAGVNSAKLRKDLSYLGSYGIRGVGYDVATLTEQIARTLGLTVHRSVALIGVGNLGQALAGYAGFASRGFRIAALLDADPARVGTRIRGLVVRDIADLESVVAEENITIAVLAIPAAAAQEVCDRLVAAGVTSILNFAPVVLTCPTTSTSARSTSPPSCRSCPSTRTARRGRVPASMRRRWWIGTMSVLVVGPVAPHGAGVGARARRRARATSCPSCSTSCTAPRRSARCCCCRPATGSRSTPTSPGSTRPWPRSAPCWPGTPGCRSPTSAEHLYVHFAEAAAEHMFSVAVRPRLDGRRRVADPRPAARRLRARHRASARSARCCTTSPRPRCGSASGCTPRPASTGPAPRRVGRARPRRRRVLGRSTAAGRVIVGAGSMGALAGATCAAGAVPTSWWPTARRAGRAAGRPRWAAGPSRWTTLAGEIADADLSSAPPAPPAWSRASSDRRRGPAARW